jgi:hypothetical protein
MSIRFSAAKYIRIRTVRSKLETVPVGRLNRQWVTLARSFQQARNKVVDQLYVSIAEKGDKILTNFTNRRCLLIVGIDQHQFHRKVCQIFDLECGTERNDLDIVLEFDIADDPMQDLFHAGLEGIGCIAFSIDGDVTNSLPRHALKLKPESIVAT